MNTQDEPKQEPFIIIHKHVLIDDRLTYGDKVLYGAIIAICALKDHMCFATNGYLADNYGLTIASIKRSITRLVACELVDVIMTDKYASGRILLPRVVLPGSRATPAQNELPQLKMSHPQLKMSHNDDNYKENKKRSDDEDSCRPADASLTDFQQSKADPESDTEGEMQEPVHTQLDDINGDQIGASKRGYPPMFELFVNRYRECSGKYDIGDIALAFRSFRQLKEADRLQATACLKWAKLSTLWPESKFVPHAVKFIERQLWHQYPEPAGFMATNKTKITHRQVTVEHPFATSIFDKLFDGGELNIDRFRGRFPHAEIFRDGPHEGKWYVEMSRSERHHIDGSRIPMITILTAETRMFREIESVS